MTFLLACRSVLIALTLTMLFTSTAQADFRYVTSGDGKPLIIFVHGLWGDPATSFKAEGESKSWPMLMRDDARSIRKARPLKDYATATLSFPAWCSTSMSITEIVAGLTQHLINEEVWVKHPSIIFIGHSLGGLVAQELLAVSRERLEMVSLVERVHGLILLSTPAHGSDDAARLADALQKIPAIGPNCQLLRDLQPIDNNSLLKKLDQQWRSFITDQEEKKSASARLRVHCLYETQPTWGRVIVGLQQTASVCDSRRLPVNADHQTIAKPPNTDADVYTFVRGIIAEIELSRDRTISPGDVPSPNGDRHGIFKPHPPVQTPHIPSQSYKMQPNLNKYVEGKGFRTYHKTTWNACLRECESDGRCLMIEFFKPLQECNLYQHSRIDGFARDADVALKRSVGAEIGPQVAPSGTRLVRRTNAYIPGTGYLLVHNSSPSRCEADCGSDKRCLSWEYYPPSGNCNLFNTRNIRRKLGAVAVVGEKVSIDDVAQQ